MSALAELLSSRVKAEVFRHLFGLDAACLHLRELGRRSGLAVGTVRQELSKLVGLGLVSERPDGNRRLYAANREHPLFPDIRSLVLKTSGLADVLREALSGESRIQIAFVFGSIAAGNERATSDIDLMVIGSLGLRALTQRLSGAGATLGRELNPYLLEGAEFRRRKHAQDHLLLTVLAAPRIYILGSEHELETLG